MDDFTSIAKPDIIFKIDACPNCEAALAVVPQRKKKCPTCSKNIHIRTWTQKKIKVLVNEADAFKIDDYWDKVKFREQWLAELESRGISKTEFLKLKTQLSEAAGYERSDGDVLWSVYNQLLLEHHNNHSELRGIYNSMAWLANQEGKDAFKLLYESQRHYLLDIKDLESSIKVEIMSLGGCENCKNQDGVVYTIQEALDKMPIPHKDCSFTFSENGKPFCRCCYGGARIDE
jgi:hypothetical protein